MVVMLVGICAGSDHAEGSGSCDAAHHHHGCHGTWHQEEVVVVVVVVVACMLWVVEWMHIDFSSHHDNSKYSSYIGTCTWTFHVNVAQLLLPPFLSDTQSCDHTTQQSKGFVFNLRSRHHNMAWVTYCDPHVIHNRHWPCHPGTLLAKFCETRSLLACYPPPHAAKIGWVSILVGNPKLQVICTNITWCHMLEGGIYKMSPS